ncbi:MAG: hypothetical protein WCY16_09265 [Weeksellaceae bacterium]
MGFFSNLPKDFIKSAVRQVGRDGGRVISNKVYGSAHAIPVKHIVDSNINFDSNTQEIQLYNKKDSWLTTFGLIVCFVFSIIPFCSFIGAIIGLVKGLRFLLMKNKTMYKVEMESILVPDRRY